MCPACFSAIYLMVAGVATTSVGGFATFAMARKIRQENTKSVNESTPGEQS